MKDSWKVLFLILHPNTFNGSNKISLIELKSNPSEKVQLSLPENHSSLTLVLWALFNFWKHPYLTSLDLLVWLLPMLVVWLKQFILKNVYNLELEELKVQTEDYQLVPMLFWEVFRALQTWRLQRSIICLVLVLCLMLLSLPSLLSTRSNSFRLIMFLL